MTTTMEVDTAVVAATVEVDTAVVAAAMVDMVAVVTIMIMAVSNQMDAGKQKYVHCLLYS